jgi:hypothetical protein
MSGAYLGAGALGGAGKIVEFQHGSSLEKKNEAGR